MEIKRVAELTIQTSRRLVVQIPASGDEQIGCPECGDSMATLATVAALFALSQRALFGFVEAEEVHFAETSDGVLYVCPRSVAEILKEKK